MEGMATLTWTTKDGLTVTLSPSTDRRVVDVYSDTQVFCRSESAAREVSRELRAWGVESTQTDDQLTFSEKAEIDCKAA